MSARVAQVMSAMLQRGSQRPAVSQQLSRSARKPKHSARMHQLCRCANRSLESSAALPMKDDCIRRGVLNVVTSAARVEQTLTDAGLLAARLLQFPDRGIPFVRSSATGELLELRCGIASRMQSKKKFRACVAEPSDVQLSEITHRGVVVALTSLSLPTQHDWRSLLRTSARHLQATAANDVVGASPSVVEDAQPPAQKKETECFVWFVLHKKAVSLEDAIRTLADAAHVSADRFAVNVVLDDQGTTSQLCSLAMGPSFRIESEESCNDIMVGVVQRMLSVNLSSSTTVRVQILSAEREPCDLRHSSNTSVQCSALLRGVSFRRSSTALAQARHALQSLTPNYFGPRRFAQAPNQQFLSYHLGEAYARGQYRALLSMVVHNAVHDGGTYRQQILQRFSPAGRVALMEEQSEAAVGDSASSSSSCCWVDAFARLLFQGDETESSYRRVYAMLPEGQRRVIQTSRECFMWNVLLSSRLVSSTSGRGSRGGDDAEGSDGGLSCGPTSHLRIGDIVRAANGSDRSGDDVSSTCQGPNAVERVCSAFTDPPNSAPPQYDSQTVVRKAHFPVAVRTFADLSFDAKWELAPTSSVRASVASLSAEAHRPLEGTITAVASEDDRYRFSDHDVLLPLRPTAHECRVVSELWRRVGFTGSTSHSDLPILRNMFLSCVAPQVEVINDIAVGGAVSEMQAGSDFRLATDDELAAVSDAPPAFALSARRPAKRPTRALSSRGRSLRDRLPVGALTASSTAAPTARVGYSLALHVTVPATSYLSSALREFVILRAGGQRSLRITPPVNEALSGRGENAPSPTTSTEHQLEVHDGTSGALEASGNILSFAKSINRRANL